MHSEKKMWIQRAGEELEIVVKTKVSQFIDVLSAASYIGAFIF